MIVTASIVRQSSMYSSKRELNNQLRTGFESLGNHWHSQYRPRHFTPRAFSLYRYTPRSRGYSRRKRRKFGHADPLVLTGTSKRLSEQRQVRATKNGVTVTMPVRVFNFKPRNSKVNMREEFTQINRAEERTLDNRMYRSLVKGLSAKTQSTTTKIGG